MNDTINPKLDVVEGEQIDLHSTMDKPKRIGFVLLFLVFGVFGIWAATAPLDGAARAAGTVTVRSYKKVVQHLEGGIVSDITARDGDFVLSGDTLLTLDATQPKAQLEIANSRFIAMKARESRLIAERDGATVVNYSMELNRNDSRVVDEIQAQEGIFRARMVANQSAKQVLEQKIEQLQSQVTGLKALKTTKEQLTASFSEELADTRVLLSQGFSEKTRLRELERNVANYEGEAADLTATIAATEVQVGEARLQLILQEQEFQKEVVSELGDVQTNLIDVSERINGLEDIVARTIITAPDNGIVNGMQVHTIGGVISSGTPIAEIVPQNEEVVIEATVSPNDIDRVSSGQDATIRFSSFGSSVPTIEGKVLNLSADSMVDESTGVGYYLARVELTPEGLDRLGDLVMVPGMPAEVFINTGSRTFLQYLFKPFSNALARSFNED